MKIKVVYYSFIKEATGKTGETVDVPAETTIAGLLEILIGIYGERLASKLKSQGVIAPYVRIFINNTIQIDYNAPLQEDDELCLFYAVAGG